MQKFSDIKNYLDSVCEQVRWKKAHATISQEVENHIQDQKEAYMIDGMDEKLALEKTLQEMGDPVVAGEQLNQIHKPRPDWIMLAIISFIIVIGTIVQHTLSQSGQGMTYMFGHYLRYMPLGVLALVIVYFVDYSIVAKYSKLLFGFTLCFMFYLSIFSEKVNGTVPNSFNISLLLTPLFAGIVYSQRNTRIKWLPVCGLFYVLALIACLIMPTLGGLIVFSASCLIILSVAIQKNWFAINKKIALAIIYTPTVLFSLLAFIKYDGLRRKLVDAFYPQLDPLGRGYVRSTVRSILSSAKLWGAANLTDDSAGRLIENILPSWNTDYMLTYFIGRFGIIAGIFIITIVFALIIRLFIIVSKQKSMLGFVMSLSVASVITTQSLVYIIRNLGIGIFNSGLPLLSFGGVCFIVNISLIGLVMSIFRYKSIVNDKYIAHVQERAISLFDGRIIIDFSKKTTT